MAIQAEIQSLSPSAELELFVMDLTSIPGGSLQFFHAGTNGLLANVVWQGNTYTPLPIYAEGFDLVTKGSLPRPRLKVANINGMFSSDVSLNNDLLGIVITRKRTCVKYLDAVNFPGGVNATADPNQHFQDDIWFINRKVNETRYVIEWELESTFDLNGVRLPFRQVVQNSCPWVYRGADCGYTGTNYYDATDTATTVGGDVCGKRLSSCKLRWGATAQLPFGGFPGAKVYG